MDPHGILTLYWIKPLEYLIAIGYLIAFVAFWRYVRQPAAITVLAGRPSDWFSLAPGVHFHPGHAWARHETSGRVTVGLDDFARKLIGPVDAVELPMIGSSVRQGEAVINLAAGDRSVAMLSPVGGRVVAVNQDAVQTPSVINDDPYGGGWLFEVKPEHWRADSHQLLSETLARRWIEGVADLLRAQSDPELGVALQDGGQPVNGIARELYGERWDEFARTCLLSEK